MAPDVEASASPMRIRTWQDYVKSVCLEAIYLHDRNHDGPAKVGLMGVQHFEHVIKEWQYALTAADVRDALQECLGEGLVEIAEAAESAGIPTFKLTAAGHDRIPRRVLP